MMWAMSFGLALASSCGSDTVGPGTGGGGGGTAATLYGDPGQCGECVATQCSNAVPACQAEPECSVWWSCLLACPVDAEGGYEASCAAACVPPTSSAGITAQTNLQTCIEGELVEYGCFSCPNSVGAPTHPCFTNECEEAPPEENTCTQCSKSHCCEHRATWLANPEAVALLECYQTCLADACLVDCDMMHPAGTADFNQFLGCTSFHCQLECAEEEADPCYLCRTRKCETSYGDSSCSEQWFQQLNCVGVCNNDIACEMDCFAAFPDETAALQTHTECLETQCADVCGI
jgi:hypothetical protein